MTKLSVNINKIATLRNSRGTNQPHLIKTVCKLIDFGVKGITVHPRPDGRHILYQDVYDIKQVLKDFPTVEFNIEGYPTSDFLQLIEHTTPHQCTLVPDAPNVLTSNTGWELQKNFNHLQSVITFLKNNNIRSSLFVDPFTLCPTELSALYKLKPNRVELYTQLYAATYLTPQKKHIIQTYIVSAQNIIQHNIKLNAGHDLNLNNLTWFLKNIPEIQEVSIGHALICEALYEGLETIVKKYLKICHGN